MGTNAHDTQLDDFLKSEGRITHQGTQEGFLLHLEGDSPVSLSQEDAHAFMMRLVKAPGVYSATKEPGVY